jgi:organic hydroperoxide reductase OsmC/OhrA
VAGRARVFDFAVQLDGAWDATSDRGGTPLPGAERETWTPEHLVLAGLVRCVLTSLAFHAGRAAIDVTPSADARGTVTRRDEDGRFAFVAIEVGLDVRLQPEPAPDAVAELTAKAERDCFVGASLTVKPAYRWTVNEREIG